MVKKDAVEMILAGKRRGVSRRSSIISATT